MKKDVENINPLKITDAETGEVYTLDFDRASVMYAERRGFKVTETVDFPATLVPQLFEYAFRKNHINVAKNKIDEIFKQLEGLTFPEIGRLVELYNRALMSNTIIAEEDGRKNVRMTVEL